jgi:hypothetical protein
MGKAWNIKAAAMALLGLLSSVAFSKPGAEQILAQKNLKGRIYAIEAFTNPKGILTGLRLAWIPKDIEHECLGKSWKWCESLDHCVRWREQSSRCKEIGADPSAHAERSSHAVPTRTLDFIVELKRTNALPKKFLSGILVYWSRDLSLNHSLEPLSRTRSVEVPLHWEHWSNGENVSLAARN